MDRPDQHISMSHLYEDGSELNAHTTWTHEFAMDALNYFDIVMAPFMQHMMSEHFKRLKADDTRGNYEVSLVITKNDEQPKILLNCEEV